jgi:hypothetical protein
MEVHVTALPAFADFIAKIGQADDLFKRMTAAETEALPPKAKAAVSLIEDALRNFTAAAAKPEAPE